MTNLSDLFFALLRLAIDKGQPLEKELTAEEWQAIYRMSGQQGLLGIMFQAVEKLPKALRPDKDLLFNWYGDCYQIESLNQHIDKTAVQVSQYYQEHGFRTCILKGQGNAVMYPNPYSRTPGDIDVWVSPRLRTGSGKFRDGLKMTIQYVRESNPKGRAIYHHIDYGMFQGSEVEVHLRPSFMNCPIYNRRLQRWFLEHQEEQFRHEVELPDGTGKINVPTSSFNIIFQLSHIYHHVLHEGIGLRQIVDYYFLLTTGTITERAEMAEKLRYLGLWKIAGALMWVLHEKLGLGERYLIAPMDERRGKVLLREILKGGNFGKYDEANIQANSQLKKNIQRIRHDFRMMRHFPSECLWEPVFRIYHYFWRLKYN